MITCQNSGSISKEYKLPPKNTMGVITKDGTIDICSKSLLTNPIKKPNKAKVKETKINKKIIKKGNWTSTSTKNEDVQNLILNERIEAQKKYNIQSTPTIIINEKKYEDKHEYKSFKKAIEKNL